jgi:YYY domain-containing protein
LSVLGNIIVWWLLSFLLSMAAFPLCHKLFSNLADRGLGFSRLAGLFLSSYLIWLLGFIHYSGFTIGLVWVGLAYLGYSLFSKQSSEIKGFVKSHTGLILVYESLFLFLFLTWGLVRMHHPEIVDQEKFMDFAFFNSIGRASRFPPFDPWLAGPGHAINYYYFGYFSMATFAKVTLADPSVAYNLVIAFLFALCGQAMLALGYNLTRAIWPGLAGVAFLQIFGNMDGALQFLTKPAAEFDWWVSPTRLIHDAAKTVGGKVQYVNAWWHNLSPGFLQKHGVPLDAVRDAAISEFPHFTFLHGDMHPHLVALPFALLALGLGLNLLKNPRPDAYALKGFSWERLLPLAAFAWVLGGMVMMNTWDLPAYGLLGSGCVLLQMHASGRFNRQNWMDGWFVPSAALLGAVLAMALPFLAKFRAPVGGFALTYGKTGLRDTLVFWGAFLAVLAPYFFWKLKAWRLAASGEKKAEASKGTRTCPNCGAKVREGKKFCAQCGHSLVGLDGLTQELLAGSDPAKSPKLASALLKFFHSPSAAMQEAGTIWPFVLFGLPFLVFLIFWPTSALFWLVMGLAALLLAARAESVEGQFCLLLVLVASGLVFGVEWVHLKDTFSGSPALVRMNTVFKFYFQAWILLAAAMPYALHWLGKVLFRLAGEVARTATLLVLSVVFLGASIYPFLAGSQVWSNYVNTSGLAPTLNGAAWLQRDYPGDYQAILAMRKLKGAPVVAEAVGSEYTHYARVSSYTGLPTVVGWPGHELQWRNTYPSEAQQDMETLYSTLDPSTAQNLIRKYDIRYVFVGSLERGKYSADQLNKFASFMDPDPVLSNMQGTTVFRTRI